MRRVVLLWMRVVDLPGVCIGRENGLERGPTIREYPNRARPLNVNVNAQAVFIMAASPGVEDVESAPELETLIVVIQLAAGIR